MSVFLLGMGSSEVMKKILDEHPTAMLIVTARVESATDRVFDATGNVAIDAVDTPLADSRAFLKKLDGISRLFATRRFVPNYEMFDDTWVMKPRISWSRSAPSPAAAAPSPRSSNEARKISRKRSWSSSISTCLLNGHVPLARS